MGHKENHYIKVSIHKEDIVLYKYELNNLWKVFETRKSEIQVNVQIHIILDVSNIHTSNFYVKQQQ